MKNLKKDTLDKLNCVFIFTFPHALMILNRHERLYIYKQIMTSLDNSIKAVDKHKSTKIHYRKHLLRLESETAEFQYMVYLNIFLNT